MIRSMCALSVLTLLAASLLPACTVRRLTLWDDFITIDGRSARRSYYQAMTFDNWRLPVFMDRLEKRDGRVHSSYYAVYSVSGKPDTAYYIGVVESTMKIDVKKPLRVVYQWTEKGFKAGHVPIDQYFTVEKKPAGGQPGDIAFSSQQPPEKYAREFVAGAFGSVSYSASTGGGFFFGIIKGIEVTFDEVRHAGDRGKEVLMGVVRFYYDGRGRLERMAVYGPSEIDVIMAEQVYRYRGDSKFPEMYSGSWRLHPSIDIRKAK